MQLDRMKVLFSIGTSFLLLATVIVFIVIGIVAPTPALGATCDSLTSPLVASPTSGDTSTQFTFSGTIANCNNVDNSGAQPTPLGITLRGISDDPSANSLLFGLKTDGLGAFTLTTPLQVGGWTFQVWFNGNALSGNNSVHLTVSQGAAYVCGDTVGVPNLPTCSQPGQLNCCPQGCPDQADIDGQYKCISQPNPIGSNGSSQVCITQVGDPASKGITAPGPLGCAGGSGGGGGGGAVNPGATCPGTGPITCLPYLNGTGCHCTPDYEVQVCGAVGACSWCNPYPQSSDYATDVSNPALAPFYVPVISVGGQQHSVTCKGYANYFRDDYPGPDICRDSTPDYPWYCQIIEVLSCADDVTGGAVWMQFHHSSERMPLVIDKIYKSGDQAGITDPFVSVGPHVHFQLGIGGPCGAEITGCVNSNEYINCP